MVESECPACGRDDFDTVGDMRRHYGSKRDEKHEGSLAYETVECKNCGKMFEGLKSQNRQFCSECEEKGEAFDEQYRKKMSELQKGDRNTNWNGKSFTEESFVKMSNTRKGMAFSEEHKENISKSKIGAKNPNYEKTGEENPFYGESHTEETKKKIGEAHKGKEVSEETKEAISEAVSGENHPFYGVTGEDHPSWKEDTTTIRYSDAFYENRPMVFERDGYKCRVCCISRKEHYNDYNMDLSAHHIIPRSEFIDEPGEKPPDEAGEMSNLFTVCISCHRKVEVGIISTPDNGNQMSGMEW